MHLLFVEISEEFSIRVCVVNPSHRWGPSSHPGLDVQMTHRANSYSERSQGDRLVIVSMSVALTALSYTMKPILSECFVKAFLRYLLYFLSSPLKNNSFGLVVENPSEAGGEGNHK